MGEFGFDSMKLPSHGVGSGQSPDQIAADINLQFQLASFPTELRRQVLRSLVEKSWGELPSYSTLRAPEISEVAKATVGTGVVPIFRHPESHEWCAVVVRPGTHYQGPRYEAKGNEPVYMIAGGFINLTYSGGSIQSTTREERPEHPHEGAVRELAEELVDANGLPLLYPDPSRLLPVDTLTLSFRSGEKRVVMGFLLELTSQEVERVLLHTERGISDPSYRRECRSKTINKESGRPEVCQAEVVRVADLASGSKKLLHPDQISLFKRIQDRVTNPYRI